MVLHEVNYAAASVIRFVFLFDAFRIYQIMSKIMAQVLYGKLLESAQVYKIHFIYCVAFTVYCNIGLIQQCFKTLTQSKKKEREKLHSSQLDILLFFQVFYSYAMNARNS